MAVRTTILLDEETRKAARELARVYECSTSEAIRRAVVRHRDALRGASGAERARRRKVLERLFELFEGSDPQEEIRRLKSEDVGF